jgi:hypothetical protein
VFDDTSDPAQAFWGIYATDTTKGGHSGIDLYYLGLRRNEARFGIGLGREVRHSLGTRLFGEAHWFDWDVEGVWQFGRFADRRISAWTLASSLGYTVARGWQPRFSISADVASGNHDPSGHILSTFNPLFPRAPYFTEASLNAPANFIDLHPGIDVKPARGLNVRGTIDFLWRESTRDAFYRQPIVPLIAATASTARHVGTSGEVRVTYNASRYAIFNVALVHFQRGAFVRAAGGGNVDYLASWATFRF